MWHDYCGRYLRVAQVQHYNKGGSMKVRIIKFVIFVIPLVFLLLFHNTAYSAVLCVDDPEINIVPSDVKLFQCGLCDGSNDCTLLEALRKADFLAGPDEIIFDPNLSGVIELKGDLFITQFNINDALKIKGPGANKLTIKGDGVHQIFIFDSPGNNQYFEVSDLKISNGEIAIQVGVGDHLKLSSSVLSGNGRGLKIDSSARADIMDSLILDNGWEQISTGVGVHTSGTANITNSLIAGNIAKFDGGGIYSGTDSITKILNTTISGNSAGRNGGGISTSTSKLTIISSTIVGNVADSDGNGDGSGGGIRLLSGADVTVKNSIIADNFRGAGNSATLNNCNASSFVKSDGYNIEDGSTCGLNAVGDLSNVNPKITDLVSVGEGDMKIHELLFDSPAIDVVPVDKCTNIIPVVLKGPKTPGIPHTPLVPIELIDDQRGSKRPKNILFKEGVGCDVGAFELACGDGKTDAPFEACDDGDPTDAGGCSHDCKSQLCGDGVIAVGFETCDDSNVENGDGCNSACIIEVCGDGIKNNGNAEECDMDDLGGEKCTSKGFALGTLKCKDDCKFDLSECTNEVEEVEEEIPDEDEDLVEGVDIETGDVEEAKDLEGSDIIISDAAEDTAADKPASGCSLIIK
jgi:cysteine-rich repeat protein